jgi:hypothetical protein
MFELFQGLRGTHIAFGSVALVLFWIPAFTKKGGRTHVRAGWAYVCCMAAVVVTAFSLSGLAFTFPLQVRHFSHVLSTEEAARVVRSSRESAFFLAYLAGVTLAAGWQGIGALRTRRDPRSLRTPFTLGLNAAVVLAAVVSLGLGIREHISVFVAMSPVGFLVSGGNLSYLLKGSQTKMHWWYEHLSSMIGTGIAGYTAFLAFGGAHLFPAIGRGQYSVVFWILPTVIGTPAIILTIAYYKRKFHEDGGPPKVSKTQVNPAM